MNPLDRPVWSALHGAQAHLAAAHGAGQAVRIDPAYGPFAAAAPGAEDTLTALLRGSDDQIWLIEPDAVEAPPGCRVVRVAPLVQLVSQGAERPFADDDIEPLDAGDAAEMAALALANQPGPWGPKTHHYGAFYGIRRHGALVAMAGERMRPAPGLAEVSGVCTDPAFRGQGMAARLIGQVMAGFAARGDTAYLHSWAGNVAAIRLYEQLGFQIRRPMVATILTRG